VAAFFLGGAAWGGRAACQAIAYLWAPFVAAGFASVERAGGAAAFARYFIPPVQKIRAINRLQTHWQVPFAPSTFHRNFSCPDLLAPLRNVVSR
jgi:hypothetical protein